MLYAVEENTVAFQEKDICCSTTYLTARAFILIDLPKFKEGNEHDKQWNIIG